DEHAWRRGNRRQRENKRDPRDERPRRCRGDRPAHEVSVSRTAHACSEHTIAEDAMMHKLLPSMLAFLETLARHAKGIIFAKASRKCMSIARGAATIQATFRIADRCEDVHELCAWGILPALRLHDATRVIRGGLCKRLHNPSYRVSRGIRTQARCDGARGTAIGSGNA